MAMPINVKICGLTDPADVPAALLAGARYVGFNFFPKSPRFASFADAAVMARAVPEGVCKVALVVDADDPTLDALLDAVPIDMIQLHGKESPARVLDVKARYGLPVMKAVGVSDESDLANLDAYGQVADQVLVDAKPPKDAVLPGGNGVPFDWALIAGRRWAVPWMLAGGLTTANVAEAIKVTGAAQVDVASAVERAPGVKDAALMADFCQSAFSSGAAMPHAT